ncbi:hypothetical protein HK097_009559 [Rhizophlyctis rosea]|uniref:FAD-binding domain-containing protein n=1 Tax=Rhizophlyctis rosea TaxID=64517 RepID=A0AAD5SBU9_9FUNG|nr:hypothetical protein HK097_009559 [Rhizophlyctis rosea]
MPSSTPHFHIVGGGPVGFLTALLIAKEGYTSTVYERNTHIPDNLEESYPLGINPRGLYALAQASSVIADHVRSTGRLLKSLEIWGSTQRYAKIDSGVVYATSRASVNLLLLEAAQENPKITIRFGHKLANIDFGTRQLEFDVLGEAESTTTVLVDASADRVIAADGNHSRVRTSLASHDPTFHVQLTPWSYECRILFGEGFATTKDLDPSIDYVINGCYTCQLTTQNTPRWTCALAVHDHDPASQRALILSQNATPQNISALQTLVKRLSPRFAPLIDQNDLTSFFFRRTFRGSIVKCSHLNHHEWIAFLGDAAHSVIPATGEGLNSGLQDASILVTKCIRSNLSTAFATYNQIRITDLHALTEYALYENAVPIFQGEVLARSMFTILEGALGPTIVESLFGPRAVERKEYGELVRRWRRKKMVILPLCRVVAWPIGVALEVVFRVIALLRRMVGGVVDKEAKEL